MPLIDIHTHQKNKAQGVFRLHNQYPLSADVSHPFSAGIHPWYVDEDNWEKQWEALKKTILNENCKAIGECGMDRNISLDFQMQQYIFKQHIELSETIKKPLIIHCVKAYAEVVALRKQYRPKQQWILHGFRKTNKLPICCSVQILHCHSAKPFYTVNRCNKRLKTFPKAAIFWRQTLPMLIFLYYIRKLLKSKNEFE